MDKVVNSILLLIISVQIACKGSDNLPPVFSGKTDFTVAEGQQPNVELKFVDPEGAQVKLSLGGGADQHHFAMTASDGLIFVRFPDFEFPSDANTDNNYELTIAASDGINQTLQPIRIEVTNVKLTVAVDNSLVFIDTDELSFYDQYMANAVALDANELFTLDGLENNSIVVSVGGTDKVSGNDLGNLVLAGYGRVRDDFNITPLSTILVNLESLNDSDLQQLLVAFGVGAELSIEDIVTLDPWGSVQRGDNSADLLLRTNQQLLNLMLTLGNLGNQDTIEGAAENNRALAAALFSYMESADGQSINLGNAQTLNSIIATVASELDFDLARDAEAIAAVSSRLGLINTALQDQTINPIGEDAAMIISAAQVVLQDAVQQLSAVEGGISTEQFEEQTSVYSLFNRLSGIESIALDSDNQHTGASSSGNNTLATAQSVANPVTLSGHLNSVGEAEAGTSTTTADIQDIFRIEASGGEVVNLIMPASYPADLDLYIYDESQNLIDYSIGDGRFESIKLPTDPGVYYVDIRTHESGASTYELTIGHNEQLATSGLSAVESTFVIGQMIVQQPSEEIEISVEGFVISQQWRSGSAVTSLYVNQNAANDASDSNDVGAILALKTDTLRTIKSVNKNSRVNYAEPNFIRQHIANPFTQWFEKRFNSPVKLSETSDEAQPESVTVAVIDTGIWEEHSDLEVAILDEQYDFVSDIRNAGDGDGIDQTATDPGDGLDNINCQHSNSAISSFHGTQVAGVIGGYEQGAEDNYSPIKLMNLRALGCNGGYDYDVANAIRYAAGLENSTNKVITPADIINMSLGADGYSITLEQAIAEASHNKVIIIAAAGNAASSDAYYPAGYDDVIAVSATSDQDKLAEYSNFGSSIDISAPGNEAEVRISATIKEGEIEEANESATVYQGTSIAAAHVTGVAALIKSAYKELTPHNFDTLIVSGEISNDFGSPGRDDNFGYGQIDEAKAKQWAERLASGESLPTITGRVGGNPIADSQLFIDKDKDFIRDEDEIATSSDADGFFTLDISEEVGLEENSVVVSVGGTDSVTGIALDDLVLAGFAQDDSLFTITPITTLLANLDTEDVATLLNSFDVEGALTLDDIIGIDPWGLPENGNQEQLNTADDLLRTNQQLLNLMLTLGSLTTDDNENNAIANNAALAATLLSYVENNAGASIDLANTDVLSAIILEVARDLDIAIAQDAQAIEAIASSLASLNTMLRDASIEPTDEVAAVTIRAAQDELQDAIRDLIADDIGVEQFHNITAVNTLFDRDRVFEELSDLDNDGLVDLIDDDDDGDGASDKVDAFPDDANESVDTDGDGTGDNTDAFPDNANENMDSDGDGTGDNSDADTEASSLGLQGSQLFVDSNGNFTQDVGESNTTSNANGFFTLDGVDDNSVIVSEGGTDVVTDNPLDDLLLAGFGQDGQAFAITPISTLLVGIGSDNDSQRLLNALGLEDGLSIDDIITTDPLVAAQQAGQDKLADPDELLRTNQQLLNLMLTVGSLTVGDEGGSAAENNTALAAALLRYVQDNDEDSIDLSDVAVLSAIIADVASDREFAIAQDAETIRVVASSLATLNSLLDNENIDPVSEAAATVISAAQAELQDAIQQLSDGSITTEIFNNKTSVSTLFGDHLAFGELADLNNDGLADLIDETEKQIQQIAAQAVIEAYAEDGVGDPPSVTSYQAAGVTGVTAANIDKVNKAVAEAAADNADTLTDQQINQIAAQAVIEAYAKDGLGDPPSLAVYEAAAVTGVTAANIDKVNTAIAQATAQATANNADALTEEQIQQIAAQAVIQTYAEDGVGDPPSLAVYEAAVVPGVTAANLDAVNTAIAQVAAQATADNADALTDQQINHIAAQAVIEAYAEDTSQQEPSVAVYEAAAITGVTAANIDKVNKAVVEAATDNANALTDQQINQVAAQAVIEAYAEDTSQQEPSVAVYEAAAVTGVTAANIDKINEAMVEAATDNANALTDQQINQIAAQAVIEAYAKDGVGNPPSEEVYKAAGVEGISTDNLDEVNDAIKDMVADASGTDIDVVALASQAVFDAGDAARVGLQNSTIFVDTDGGFIQDADETATTSNDNGYFTLDDLGDDSIVVSVGGTDVVTENALDDLLLAGFGQDGEAFAITPISTLLVNFGSEDSLQSKELLTALGLEAIEDIAATDPLALAQNDDQSDLLRTNQQLLNLMLTANSLIADDNTEGDEDGVNANNELLANTLSDFAKTNESIDLTDSDLLASIIKDIAPGLADDKIKAIASSLAALNSILGDDSIDPTDEVAVTTVSVAQDELQDAIQQLSAGDIDVDRFNNDTATNVLLDDVSPSEVLTDTDDDGVPDVIDADDDNDGILDRDELFDLDKDRTGTISIDGSASLATGPREHETLEVVVQGNDIDPNKLNYQWYRVDDNFYAESVDGAQSNSYTLSLADAGYKIKVEVTYSDDSELSGHSDSIESDLSGVVEENIRPTAHLGSITVKEQESRMISLSGEDPDGTIPPTFAVTSLPNDGTLIDNYGESETVIVSGLLPYDVIDRLYYQSELDNPTSPTSFMFKAYDGHLYSEEATFAINIESVNDAPSITSEALDAIIDEDKVYNYTVSANDIDGDALTLTAAVSKDGTEVTNSWLSLTDASDGNWLLSGIPTNDDVGDHEVTITADDGSESVTQSFTLTVSNTNDAPVINSTEGPPKTFTEDFGPIVIDENLLLSDDDSSYLQKAKVWINSVDFVSGEDVLEYPNDSGVLSGGFNSEKGILEFSVMNESTDFTLSNGRLEDYEEVLRKITYNNTSDYPAPHKREIVWQVQDKDAGDSQKEGLWSETFTSTIEIIETDDAPSGLPSIVGDPKENEELTVNTGQIEDYDGIDADSWDYTWYRIDDFNTRVLIGTSTNYILGQADVDHRIVVKVDFKDTDGRQASKESNPSEKVQNVNADVELDSLSGDLGFKIIVANDSGDNGWSVSDAGDINGDDIDDLIIGDQKAKASYVVFGAENLNEVSLGNLGADGADGTVGFKIFGEKVTIGWSVSGAGDINGDGYDDLIIGAPFADNSYDGISYVVYGQNSTTRTEIDLGAFDDHDYSDGFKIVGQPNSDGLSGFSVSDAGDVNGDGYDDLVIGAPSNENFKQQGISYVVYGQKEIRHEDVELNNSYEDYPNGFTIFGESDGDLSGHSVSSAGDIDGDGFDDLIIGARYADSDADDKSGISYVVYGKDNRSSNVFLGALGDNGFKIIGAGKEDYSGGSVSGAGDINGDGFDDLIIGASGAELSDTYFSQGISYVVYGQGSKTSDSIELGDLGDLGDGEGLNNVGFRIIGDSRSDRSGYSVSGAGDINGDGYDDLIIGAYTDEPDDSKTSSGISYVVYGQGGADRVDIDLSDFNGDYTNGFKIIGESTGDYSGRSVSGAGDINRDGFDDLIIGAHDAGADDRGTSYVVYGGASNYDSLDETQDGTSANDDKFVGSHGGDNLNGAGGEDVLIGGAGDDVLVIADATFIRIDGGNGEDTLKLDSEVTLDFITNNYRTSIQDIEVIDMTTNLNGTLVLTPIDVLNLSTTSNKLTVIGDPHGSKLQLWHSPTDGTDWEKIGDGWEDSSTAAVIKVDGVEVEHTYEPAVTVDTYEFQSIDLNPLEAPPNVRFNNSQNSLSPHFLYLGDDAVEALDGLTELTIKIKFELDFKRSSGTEHAYLFSLAKDNELANMLSIFLKDRGKNQRNYEWDLSVWVEDEQATDPTKTDQRIFVNTDWIRENQEVVLWVAIDLVIRDDSNKNVLVWEQRIGESSNLESVVNECVDGNKADEDEVCRGDVNNVDLFEVGKDGAVFGNDQDLLGANFDYHQAFEGEFYELKIYDKSFNPTDGIPANATLIYSLLPGNVVAE